MGASIPPMTDIADYAAVAIAFAQFGVSTKQAIANLRSTCGHKLPTYRYTEHPPIQREPLPSKTQQKEKKMDAHFEFEPDERVTTPFGDMGIVSQCSIDDNRKINYYVLRSFCPQWFKESELTIWEATKSTDETR